MLSESCHVISLSFPMCKVGMVFTSQMREVYKGPCALPATQPPLTFIAELVIRGGLHATPRSLPSSTRSKTQTLHPPEKQRKALYLEALRRFRVSSVVQNRPLDTAPASVQGGADCRSRPLQLIPNPRKKLHVAALKSTRTFAQPLISF